jgi:hypothetical protein
MTTTSSSKDNGRSHKGKRRSISNAASPSDDLNGNPNGTEPSGTSSGGGGRAGKRVREDTDDPPEEKRPRNFKKSLRVVDESDMAVDGEGDGDEDGGDTRCVCGKGGEYFRIKRLKSVADRRELCFPGSTQTAMREA